MYGVPAGVPQPTNPASLASINAAAALRNYKLNPRLGMCACSPAISLVWVMLQRLIKQQLSCDSNAGLAHLFVMHCPFADYNTISGVSGPLTILNFVKVRSWPAFERRDCSSGLVP